MTENYLSGKKRSLKLGVSGHSENLTSLQTVGGVGIGTTNTDKRALYVVGNTEITGVLTASQFKGDGSGLTGVAATDHVSTFDLVVAGISTFHDDVRITGGGINAVGVITGTSFDGAISEWVLGADGSSHYTFTGPGLTGAENDPIIYLKRGQKYRFKNASGGHPFRIQSDPNGSSGTAYNDGITNNDAGDGTTLAWNVQFDTPNVLYYQCTSHGNMGGKIYIGNSGESATIGSGGLVISGVTTGINAAGVSSFIQLDVNTGGIDVDGPTELDELNVTGVSTFTSSLKVDGAVDIGTGGLDVDGQTDLDELVVAGVSTFTGNIVAATAEFSGNVTIGGTLTVEDKTNVDSIGLITARTGVRVTAGGIDVTAGVSTFNDTVKFDGAVDIGTGGVDIDGQLDVDELIVAGVSTFSKAIDLNAGIDVDGQADLDEVVVAGVATFSNDVFVGTAITIHAGNVHATGIISAIKFVGDGSQITNLPGINTLGTSNLSDVNVSGTTTTSQLRVSGIGTAEKFFVSTGGLDVDGQTDLDELVVAGVATFSAYPSIDADNEIQVGTAIQLGKAGVITATSFEGSGANLTGIAATDHVSTFDLVVAGISTFNDDVRVLGGGVNVTGVSTFNDNVHLLDSDKLLLGGSAGTHDGLEIYHNGSHNYINDTGSGHLYFGGSQIFITDSTQTKTSGLFNPNTDTQLYYNNSQKFATTAVGATVFGNFKSTTLHVAGISTLTGDINFVGSLNNVSASGISSFVQLDVSTGGLDVDGQTDLDELVVAGVATFSGYLDAASRLYFDKGTGTKYMQGSGADIETKIGSEGDWKLTLNSSGGTGGTFIVEKNSGTSLFEAKGTGAVDINGTLNATGISSFTAYPAIDADNEVQVGTAIQLGKAGVVTATSFSGSGADLTSLNAANLGSGTIPDARFPATLPAISGVNLTNLPTGINTANDSTFKDLSITGLKVAGISTFNSAVNINAVVDIDGQLDVDELVVAGVATFSKAIDLNAGIDVDGQADLDELVVAGVATFSAYPSIDADNEIQVGTAIQLGKAGVITASSYRGDGSQLSGVGTQGINIQARSLVVSGVSTFYDDVKIVGGGSTAGNQITIGATTLNDGTLTFDGSAGQLFSITNNLTDGSIFSVNDVSGMPSIDVGAAGTIQLAPHGAGELVGIGTTRPTSKLDVVGDVQVVGVVTATSFSGSGANLTGVGTQSLNVQAQSLTVAGMSTFFGGLFLPDSTTLRIGGAAAGGDLQLYHNGSNTYIDNSTGTLHIRHSSGTGQIQILDSSQGITIQGKTGEDSIKAVPDAQVELYYNDALKLATNTGGITVTGGGNFSGIVSATSFEGSGANLTGVGTQSLNVQAQSLTVAGVSTFNGAVSINAASGFPFTVQASNSTIPAIKINNQSGTQRGQILANDFLNIEAFGNDIIFDSNHSGGTAGDILLKSNSTTIVEVPGDGAGVVVTGIVTASLFSGAGILDEDDMASDSATKLATQQSIKAYVDANAGGGGGTGDFYVGFTSSVTMNAASYETTGHTFPSTASKTYTIDSIMASNIANVGVGTTVNLIASISSNSGVAAGTTEQTYFAYNVPIAAGGAVELIKEPFVANPNDIVKLWATDSTYSGISSAIQVHMTYTQQDSTDFFGKYAANTSIGSTTIIGIHTAGPTYAAALQSIHITNRSDAGAFPVDILLTDSTGIVTTYLVKNLVIPKYSAVEILERPKRMETGSSLGVKVQQTGTIDVIVSGKTYS